MKNDILELHYSLYIKKTLQKIHITKVSDLKEYDCLTLAKALPEYCDKVMIIKKLNDLGYLSSAENAISIHDIPMSRKMRNIFLEMVSYTLHSFLHIQEKKYCSFAM